MSSRRPSREQSASMESNTDSGAAVSRPKKSRNHLLNLTLAGLPELQHFRSPQERQAALNEIGGEAGNPKSGAFWAAVAAIVVSVITARMLAAWLLSYVVWPGVVEEIIRFAAIFGSFLVMLRWLHRRGAAGELRAKLLSRGIPVCVKCGYLLHALPEEVGRCPECGREFDPDVRRILRADAKTMPN